MTILATMPGRAGDLLWALPSIRALSRRLDQPIDLLICGEFAGMVPLLERQPYLGRVYPLPTWGMSQGWEPPPLRSPEIPDPYDRTLHLGYRRWPEVGLPYETRWTYQQHYAAQLGEISVADLDLSTPWITLSPTDVLAPATPWLAAFSETHFELKYGLWRLLTERALTRRHVLPLNISVGARWQSEGGLAPIDWLQGARWMAQTDAVLADCSGWHVLAVAMGIPVVMYEPMEARHNPIFFPLGWDGPQVTRVVGNDGEWTQDSRHTRETLEQVRQLRVGVPRG